MHSPYEEDTITILILYFIPILKLLLKEFLFLILLASWESWGQNPKLFHFEAYALF